MKERYCWLDSTVGRNEFLCMNFIADISSILMASASVSVLAEIEAEELYVGSRTSSK